jgi:hypothetical protein
LFEDESNLNEVDFMRFLEEFDFSECVEVEQGSKRYEYLYYFAKLNGEYRRDLAEKLRSSFSARGNNYY